MQKEKKSVRRTVKRGIDGDTFEVSRKVWDSRFIRIAGVDCPEKGERGYGAAKKRLSKLLKGQKVTIRPKGKSYGRTVAEVIFKRKNLKGVC